MKIKNSTAWSDEFLRRMTAWCCRELEIPVRLIKTGVFRNSRSTWGGLARGWRRQISVCVSPRDSDFPASCSTHRDDEKFVDRIECLVAVTAHEAYHIAADRHPDHQQKTRRRDDYGSSERITCNMQFKALNAFRANRKALLAEWNVPVKEAPKVSPQVQRAKEAEDRLAAWQKKAKLAATKIRKYRARVTYYNRVLERAAAPKQGSVSTGGQPPAMA